jgi:hypothetical protein
VREAGTLAFLAIFVFWIGFNPGPLLKVMDKSVSHLVEQVERGKKDVVRQVSREGAEGAEKAKVIPVIPAKAGIQGFQSIAEPRIARVGYDGY